MEYRLLCQKSNGGLSIICDKHAASAYEMLQRNSRFIPEGTIEYKVVTVAELNPDYLDNWHKSPELGLVNAMVLEDGAVSVDMEKARLLHMDTIRALRNEKLVELDIETLKGNDVQAEKQVLRDIPQTFDLTIASTPEELIELIPEELK